MKTISNRRETWEYGVLHVMDRVIDGKQYRYSVAVTHHELEVGRDYVAQRLRRARRELVRMIDHDLDERWQSEPLDAGMYGGRLGR